jgi:hypothetical protein
MSLLANNLIVLLYFLICRLQDNSSAEGSAEGRVEGKNKFHVESLSLHSAEKKRGLVREVYRHERARWDSHRHGADDNETIWPKLYRLSKHT